MPEFELGSAACEASPWPPGLPQRRFVSVGEHGYIYLFLYATVCISWCLYRVCLCVYLCFFVPVLECVFLCVSVFLCLCLCLCVSVSMYVFVCDQKVYLYVSICMLMSLCIRLCVLCVSM